MELDKYLESLSQEHIIKAGLDRISRLVDLRWLQFPTVHIAGTNGKGSIATLLSSILTQAGYKVGTYTSPHLLDVCERIKINTKNIPYTYLEHIIMDELYPTICELADKPSYFEVLTAAALKYFCCENVDIGVIEVGLGGRLDATNIINPLVVILSNISLEHTDILGNTIEEIACEKFGIVKGGVSVISCIEQPNLKELLTKICMEKNATLYQLNQDFFVENYTLSLQGTTFTFRNATTVYEDLRLKLLGRHQLSNAAAALAASNVLTKKYGFCISEAAVRQGIDKAYILGRAQLIHKNSGEILLDGAHNPAGVEVLVQLLNDYFTNKRYICLLGILRDKDIEGMLRALIEGASDRLAHLVATSPRYPSRAAEPDRIADSAKKLGFDRCKIVPNIAGAFEYALSLANEIKDGLLVVSGSLYTVADILTELEYNIHYTQN